MIAMHIIAVRIGWFHMWMGAGHTELAALGAWDEKRQPGHSAGLVSCVNFKKFHFLRERVCLSFA